MKESEINLTKLLDIVRKDPGINSAMSAVEQLSLLILLKYFFNASFHDGKNPDFLATFRNSIFDSKTSNNESKIEDFIKLNVVLRDLVSNVKESVGNYPHEIYTSTLHIRVKALLEAIPFRIRSAKVLEMLLSQLDMIEFDESFAEAYDYLIIRMVDASSASGAFHSPKALVAAIVKAIDPSPLQSIYDPALGTGRFIIESKKLMLKANGDEFKDQIRVYGKDISPTACLIGTLNLLLNGIDIDNISIGDSLLNDDDLTYDVILSGVPFGKAENESRYAWSDFQYLSSLEAMFLQLTMEKLGRGGKAALIVPDGLLFNKANELNSLRYQLLTRFNLRAILSLPIGAVAPYSGVKVSVLFFEKNNAEEDIWFYKLNTERPFGKNNQISEFDLAEFVDLFPQRIETENSCLIRKSEVLSCDFIDLSFDLSARSEQQRLFIPSVFSSLKESKGSIDKLWFSLIESLGERHEIEFSKRTTLGNLVTLTAGKMLSKTKVRDEGKYPVYGGNGIIGYYDEHNRVGENIIIGRVGANCGNVHIVNSPIWVTDNSFTVDLTNSMDVYPPYLAHVLRSMNLRKLARGVAQPSISNSTVKDIEINLPSFEKQIELCQWFDDIRTMNNELSKLIQLRQDEFNLLTDTIIATNCGATKGGRID